MEQSLASDVLKAEINPFWKSFLLKSSYKKTVLLVKCILQRFIDITQGQVSAYRIY
jgi:hypothetical protein